MKRTMTMMAVLALAHVVPAATQTQSLPRSANGGPEMSGRGPAAVLVPRYPYAGAWDGSLILKNDKGVSAEGGIETRVAMKFTVADGAKQSYGGETMIDGRAARPHINISAAAATSDAGKADSPVVARRSSSSNAPSGPAVGGAPEMDTLASSSHALLLYHTPSKSMLLCDEGHKCVTLATLAWEEQGADGRRHAFSAQLVSADTIKGTVTVTGGSAPAQTGTFTLSRRK